MSTTEKTTVSFILNDLPQTLAVNPLRRFSDVLREDLGLTGTKVGCDAGDCGACTILVDGEQRYACLTAVGQLEGHNARTVEGLAKNGDLTALQQAFLDEGAAQCGICTPGMLMAAQSLLDRTPNPTEAQVLDALGGVLCRCTGYTKIVEAVLKAGQTSSSEPTPSSGSAVGSRMVKVDGKQKVTGEEIYSADYTPEDSLWLRAIRSPHPRAKFTLAQPEKVLKKYPGIIKILTADDVTGNNGFGIYPHIKDQPVLAKDHVRFRGEAVVALIGERENVESVSEEDLGLTWEPLEAIRGCDAALSGKLEPVQSEIVDNILAEGFLKKNDVEKAFAESFAVAEGVWTTSAVEHGYLEPEAGYATKIGQRLEIFVCTQSPYMDQTEVAQFLGIEPGQVRIIPSAVGGGFGGKLDISVQPLVALAAWILGRPVRSIYTRPESMVSTTKRHPVQMSARAGCSKDGKLTAYEYHGDFNTGAYASWGPTVADRVPVHCSGPYFVPNVLSQSRALLTNESPSGAFRGFGTPQAAIANDALLDVLAEKIGMDTLEFRIKNALRKGDRTATNQLLENSVGQVECLESLKSRWVKWRKQAEDFNQNNKNVKRGVGCGSAWYGCGNTSLSNPSTIRVGINGEGKLTLYNGAMDIGQGTNTIMVQICADALGLPASQFEYVMGDTDLTADAGKTSASRQAFVSGKATQLAGEHLRGQIIQLAEASENATLYLEQNGSVGSGKLIVEDESGEHVIVLADILPQTNGDVLTGEGTFDPPTTTLDENGQGSPYATYGFGAHIAEVEVDTLLGTTKVLRLAAAHDVGKTINPTQVEGQIQGGIAQGLGMALMEEYVQCVSENLHDYLMPTVGDMPEIEIILIEDPEPLGPYGAKGIGEHALIPTAPAILAGIKHATGISIRHVPATPDRVFTALQEAGK
ncbi:MAG: molybdopterin-dependent oxidoreductase [SAR324 cluster bacterium]|jgi:CO/xanthine dehydrogenase Mo-binding subunit/aerobic-type carbon monoxide dehydrogenase small subunit (CoxS/CutS family)|nr:molybdopterin-dependent oxidoreductase [SAR324 cluster bacterium]MDP7615136.1 molybdopterin-dependent oxidoreductase [SAR324 cluster bacterium]